MELQFIIDIFCKVSEHKIPVASLPLLYLLVKQVHSFRMRKTPLKSSKRFYPNGKVKEINKEFRK